VNHGNWHNLGWHALLSTERCKLLPVNSVSLCTDVEECLSSNSPHLFFWIAQYAIFIFMRIHEVTEGCETELYLVLINTGSDWFLKTCTGGLTWWFICISGFFSCLSWLWWRYDSSACFCHKILFLLRNTVDACVCLFSLVEKVALYSFSQLFFTKSKIHKQKWWPWVYTRMQFVIFYIYLLMQKPPSAIWNFLLEWQFLSSL